MASFEHIAQRLVTSVPSIGGSKPQTLEAALARVARAETELATARAEARRLGRAEGKKLSSLFEESLFVKRSSMEAFCEEARREGYSAGIAWQVGAFERAVSGDGPFHMAGLALVRAHREGREFGTLRARDAGAPGMSEVDAIQARILKSRETDFSNQMEGAPTESGKIAEAVLKAGAKARTPTGAHKDDAAPMNALSAEILRQGRRRRGEEQ